MTAPPRLRVRIERLVIDGPPDLRARDLASALTAELERLAAARSVPARDVSTELARRAPAELVVDLATDPEAGGRAIAAAVHARLAAARGVLPEVTRG